MSTPAAVRYSIEPLLSVDEFIDVLRRSGLAERRPVDDPDRIAAMLRNASLTICARDNTGLLIGVSRCLTDFVYCCYCSELAVDAAWQRRGIGRELIRRSIEAAGPGASFHLLSAPAAMDYYPRAGLERLDNCFGIKRTG